MKFVFINFFFIGYLANRYYCFKQNYFNATIVGRNLIGLNNIIPEIQISMEFEQLNVNRRFKNNIANKENYWYPALFLGAGYSNRNMTFLIRYDVLYDGNKSIFADAWVPFVRVFF